MLPYCSFIKTCIGSSWSENPLDNPESEDKVAVVEESSWGLPIIDGLIVQINGGKWDPWEDEV